MTDTNQLIKAFVKTLEEATNTSGLTSTQFECFTLQCRRVVMDSLDIGRLCRRLGSNACRW